MRHLLARKDGGTPGHQAYHQNPGAQLDLVHAALEISAPDNRSGEAESLSSQQGARGLLQFFLNAKNNASV